MLVAATAIGALVLQLGSRWLVVAVLVIAAGRAGARALFASRRARTERERERTESTRLLHVAVASVGDIDPTLIGVDRAEQDILPGVACRSMSRARLTSVATSAGAALDGDTWRAPSAVAPSFAGRPGADPSAFSTRSSIRQGLSTSLGTRRSYAPPRGRPSARLICPLVDRTCSPSPRPLRSRILSSSANVSSSGHDGCASSINVMLFPSC